MTPDGTPTLIVDIGGTLITRTRLGLRLRVVDALVSFGAEFDAARMRLVAAAVLTSPDRESCARVLSALYPRAAAAISAVLGEDDGEAIVLPGARRLLETATSVGWRVIAATNAAAETPPLPDDLARHLTSIAQSSDYGEVKESSRFWTMLLSKESVDPLRSCVVGNDVSADRIHPRNVGLQTRLVTPHTGGLLDVAGQIATAGRAPADAEALLIDDGEIWARRRVVTAPHLAPLVNRVTRAPRRFVAAGKSYRGVVVRRRSLPPAVVLETSEPPGAYWLLRQRPRRGLVMPADLRDVLTRYGLSLDHLSAEDQRHAVSLVREARSLETKARRTEDLVRFLIQRAERR